MLDGAYAELAGYDNVLVRPDNPRTGSAHLRMECALSGGDYWRFAFKNGPVPSIGVGYSSYIPVLPSSDGHIRTHFCDGANGVNVFMDMSTTGVMRLFSGKYPFALLGQTAGPVMTAQAHYHVEAFVTIHPTAGVFKLAINEQLVMDLSGIATKNPDSATTEVSQLSFICGAGYGSPRRWDMDDFYIYDTQGTLNNAFPVGDMRVMLETPVADTTQADFTKSVGTDGFSLINEVTPDDAGFVQASAPGQKSDFELTDVPPEITLIAGIFVHTRASKSDAGPAQLKSSIVSAGIPGGGQSRPMTTNASYWSDAVEKDPATNQRWTRAAVNAARVRYERTV